MSSAASRALPRSHLLKKGREFEKVYRRGRRLRTRGFSLIFVANDVQYNRLGISIHRKLKGAVRRNRIKRIVKETFRNNRSLFPPSADIVITVRPDFPYSTPDEFRAAVAGITPAAQASR